MIHVLSCKPGPVGCNNANSNFNVLLMPNAGQALNYDPNSQTWTFGSNYYPQNTPQISPGGTVQAYNLNAINNVTAQQVGVGGAYLFNLGGAVGLSVERDQSDIQQLVCELCLWVRSAEYQSDRRISLPWSYSELDRLRNGYRRYELYFYFGNAECG